MKTSELWVYYLVLVLVAVVSLVSVELLEDVSWDITVITSHNRSVA